MGKRYGLLPISVMILVLCFVGTASAGTWYVDDDGGADFTEIQEAINKASAGDSIIVHSGVYYENVVVDKSITLKGIGQPVLDAGGKGDAITLTADGITLEGFTANPGCRDGAGIKAISSSNIITGNNVCNNKDDGIVLSSSSNNSITGNNVCKNNGYGIYLEDSCNNNTISGNNASSNNWCGIQICYYCNSCNNNCITGNNVSKNNRGGICLSSSNNNTITGNNVRNNNDGISIWHSSNNIVTGNNVSNNRDNGIYLYGSSNNSISGNNVSSSNNNNDGIALDGSRDNTINGNTFVNAGLHVYYSYQNTVEDNTVNGKPLFYLEEVSNYKVEDAGQVIIVNCNNITVQNLDLSNTSGGITLWKTEDSKVLNNSVSNNYYGISLGYSRNNTIGDNIVCNNSYGIALGYSINSTITGNNVCNNSCGISLVYSINSSITGNNVCNNNLKGILLYCSGNNHLYLNNFINNTDNVDWLWYRQGYESANIWNSTEKITYTYDGSTYESYLGNYWDDYEGTDADRDGIGDTPYSTNSSYYGIDTEKYECDAYPLMKPFENYIT